MATKKLFFLLSILASMFTTKAMAYDVASENADGVTIYYNYINNQKELEVTDYSNNRYSGSVAIPEQVTYNNKTLKVTSIGKDAFYKCTDLTAITIPGSMKKIGEHAFYGCNGLTTVSIPNSVTTIGEQVFRDCKGLTTVTIGNGVTTIAAQAFYRCNSLTTLTIGNGVTSIGDGAFSSCTCLTSVILPNKVKTIGSGAFAGCSGLTTVVIPGSVTSIESEAFRGCTSLPSVTIPASVTKIGEKAFEGWGMPEVVSKIEDPFAINLDTFSDNTFANATLYVPYGTLNKYKAAKGWKKFANMQEGDPSGITGVENEGASELRRYTFDGKAINTPHKRINIIQMNNGTTKKVIVK